MIAWPTGCTCVSCMQVNVYSIIVVRACMCIYNDWRKYYYIYTWLLSLNSSNFFLIHGLTVLQQSLTDWKCFSCRWCMFFKSEVWKKPNCLSITLCKLRNFDWISKWSTCMHACMPYDNMKINKCTTKCHKHQNSIPFLHTCNYLVKSKEFNDTVIVKAVLFFNKFKEFIWLCQTRHKFIRIFWQLSTYWINFINLL